MTAVSITVKQVLDQKGGAAYSVTSGVSVFEALGVMAKHNVGALLVIDDGKLVGIFSERDYSRNVALKGLHSRELKVGEVMTRNVVTAAPTEQLAAVMQTMTNRRFRHLPVLQDGELLGIISIGDVVKAIIQEQESTIHQLSSYIAGDLTTYPPPGDSGTHVAAGSEK